MQKLALKTISFRLGTIALAMVASGAAMAWKPKTHVYLAMLAWDDAKDGFVTINRVNYETGQVLGKIGDYRVRQDLKDAIAANMQSFVAGILGPDAYPDIITGQSIIHPENVPALRGTDSWLQHIWTEGMKGTPAVKAFTVGYMIHAAGDMYAHTYMNKFAGGDFAFGPNALRHLVLEGYIGTRTPFGPEDAPYSINSSVRDFIYRATIDGRPGTHLGDNLLVVGRSLEGETNTLANFSVPLIFNQLRAKLVADIGRLNSGSTLERTVNQPKIAYLTAWIADIDAGLKAWPATSHQVARQIIFPVNEAATTADRKKALEDIWRSYVNNHLLSMMGLPDGVGATREAIHQAISPYMDAVSDYLNSLAQQGIDFVLMKAFGMTYTQFVDSVTRPENYFNQVLGPNSPKQPGSSPTNITLTEFNTTQLRQNASTPWILEQFPPAYNTVLMTKLILLDRAEVNRLVSDTKAATRLTLTTDFQRPTLTTSIPTIGTTTLLATPTLTLDNIMLGFNHKLDGDTQWRANAGRMILEAAGVYKHVFLKQFGERETVVAAPLPSPSRNVTVTIELVEQIDSGIDPLGGKPDFYPVVKFDGASLSLSRVLDDESITPNWNLTRTINADLVDIEIAIYDEDGGLLGDDDLCDINPTAGKKTLRLTYNLNTGAISGDRSGSRGQSITVSGGGDSDRVRVRFKINH